MAYQGANSTTSRQVAAARALNTILPRERGRPNRRARRCLRNETSSPGTSKCRESSSLVVLISADVLKEHQQDIATKSGNAQVNLQDGFPGEIGTARRSRRRQPDDPDRNRAVGRIPAAVNRSALKKALTLRAQECKKPQGLQAARSTISEHCADAVHRDEDFRWNRTIAILQQVRVFAGVVVEIA